MKIQSAAFVLLLAAACTPAPAPEPAPAPVLSVAPYTFTAGDGTQIEAELGKFEVPENRSDPNARKITLSFVRFPSTSQTPAEPIVYLAGGPGGSGTSTATGARFPLFMKLREHADVIAFDQRGTGMSNDLPQCDASDYRSEVNSLTREGATSYYREGLIRCFQWWENEGYDIDGYTTLESAHDLDDLRRALGADKIDLWGISYGSHLGLAMMKYHPGAVNRAVLAGIEGLDETVKLPAGTDAYFARVQAVIDADPKAKAVYPDLAALMRRVHAKLDAEPATVSLPAQGGGDPAPFTFDGFAVRMIASQSISDPRAIARLPSLYLALDAGMYGIAANILSSQFLSQAATFDGMPPAMDLASGVTAERLAIVEQQASTSLLSDALNFPMPHVLGIRPGIDLGDDFRAPFTSDIPTLFISGTLDGRTYPEEAKKTVAGFANGHHLIVEYGGHNIYEADPRIGEAVLAWFRGEAVAAMIHFDPPVIATP